jgi:hypothetical protein
MKKIVLLNFLLIQITLFSQEKLIGNYCTIPIGESDVTCINFKENNRFVFILSGCLGTYKYGIGNFEIKSSDLILSFDNNDKEFRSEIEISEIKNTTKDSIIHKFKFVDQYGIKMMGVNLHKESGEFEFNENISNPNGIITFKYLKNQVNENYEVEFFGYENFKFRIENDKSYEILIKLALSKSTWIFGEKRTYQFERIDKELIKIQGEKYKLNK